MAQLSVSACLCNETRVITWGLRVVSRVSFDDIASEIARRSASHWSIAACLASCAQRLFPELSQCCQSRAPASSAPTALGELLDYIWESIAARSFDEGAAQAMLVRCQEYILDEDEAAMAGHPYAEDAVAAVAFCLRFLISNQIQEAIWGVRRLYEAVDNFAIRKYDIDVSTIAGEIAVLETQVVQRELQRQIRDLCEAAEVEVEATKFIAVCRVLRDRAIAEAKSVFC